MSKKYGRAKYLLYKRLFEWLNRLKKDKRISQNIYIYIHHANSIEKLSFFIFKNAQPAAQPETSPQIILAC